MRDVMKELARLRAKHGRDRSLVRQMPSLKCEQNVAPLSNLIPGGTAARRRENKSPSHLIVDTLHKQGPQVIAREDIQWAGGRKPK